MISERAKVEIYLDGVRQDIPEDASFRFIYGYAMLIEWWDRKANCKRGPMYLNYRCVLDGVPIEHVDVEARSATGRHKLEMFSTNYCRVAE